MGGMQAWEIDWERNEEIRKLKRRLKKERDKNKLLQEELDRAKATIKLLKKKK